MMDRETLIALLLAHKIEVRLYDGVFCACGDWSIGRAPGAGEAHAGHVADALLAHDPH